MKKKEKRGKNGVKLESHRLWLDWPEKGNETAAIRTGARAVLSESEGVRRISQVAIGGSLCF